MRGASIRRTRPASHGSRVRREGHLRRIGQGHGTRGRAQYLRFPEPQAFHGHALDTVPQTVEVARLLHGSIGAVDGDIRYGGTYTKPPPAAEAAL